MPNTTGAATGPAGSSVYASQTSPLHELGHEVYSRGRRYKYVMNGAVLQVAGNCLQAPAQVVNHQGRTPVAASIGDKTITMTPLTTAITANQYAGGYISVDATTGDGYAYQIKSHPAWTSGTMVVTLMDDDPVQVAIATTSLVSLTPGPYGSGGASNSNGVIQCPVTTGTNTPVGVSVYPIPASSTTVPQFGWIGVYGPFSTLNTGTSAVNSGAIASSAVAGAVIIAATIGVAPVVGTFMMTGVDAKQTMVFWRL